MSKAKTDGKVPSTTVAPPKTINCTKTQKELFQTRQRQGQEGGQVIMGKYNEQLSINLGKLIDDFILELKIDTEQENWTFDADKMQFKRTPKDTPPAPPKG